MKGARRPRTRGLKHPRSALVRVHPRRVVVVNVSERGRRRKEHDEAVKMGNFSRDGKHEEEIIASKRANRCCRARGAPGVGRVSVTVTFSAIGSINTTFETGMSL